ncbi:MAG: deoxyribose-phosphate aldolase [Actinomycetia bacterium]|nr:deoxyribose-phosphate aldolase [Actinomycetes bacterium]
MITKDLYRRLIDIRAHAPERVLELARRRRPRPLLVPDEKLSEPNVGGDRLFLVAADHPARGAIGVGDDPLRMADRRDLLSRLSIALSHPGVDGLLATPDIIEDLLLLGSLTGSSLLDNKVVFGSMNRGGLAGSAWELDDPITAYHAAGIYRMNLDGGKLLLRIDRQDPNSLKTIYQCARGIRILSSQKVPVAVMLEPLPAYRDGDGVLRIDTSPEALIGVIAIASGLGPTSAYTWLKLPPPSSNPMAVFAASTLPVLLLGGDPGDRGEELLTSWEEAMQAPTVRGLVAGRSLIYPADDDVGGWVDRAARIVHPRI